MGTTIRYIFLTARRDYFFIALVLAVLASLFLGNFLGDLSQIEKDETKIAYFAGISRIILMVGLIIFVSFHVRRSFENKEIDIILTKPITRAEFVLSYWLGFVAVAFILVVLIGLLLAGQIRLFPSVGFAKADLGHFLASLMLESVMISGVAIFSALILKSAVSSVLLSLGFYILGRMLGFFIYMIDGKVASYGFTGGAISEKFIIAFSMIYPRLDLFANTDWLFYGFGDASLWIIIRSFIIFTSIIFVATLIDFKKKQF